MLNARIETPAIAEEYRMCQRIVCPKCGKPTYRGCGNHVEQVLGDVPADRRCSCAAEQPRRKSWRLFRR